METPNAADKGHIMLINDLATILAEAQAYEFHDFVSTKYATPKMKLVEDLESIIRKVKEGEYDN